MAEAAQSRSLEYTPTWIVAVICSIIVLISLIAERGLHHLGKFLKRRRQDALYEALQKLQEDYTCPMMLDFV
ncbi:seven transmembrane MLO family protein [Artemisia annua]|uniref:Seven transmembrane MLO family protein n=1 Tax=Artemisia annua TaxID=35608 RepID=A0A2U1PAM5_ARTAN|nr:seven transmembrane MLO family protein [Artemisia annua]